MIPPADADSRIRGALALCACPTRDPAADDQLARCLAGRTDWPAVETAAEAHGLGPLVYARLEAAHLDVPPAARLGFRGLYLRHGRQNLLRMRALREILAAFEGAGVPTLVLKGAALANLIYARPGLRPMGDLDLLVHPSDVGRAQQVLRELDFRASLLPGDRMSDKHLLVIGDVDGLPVRVELHHRLFPERLGGPEALDLRGRPTIPFTLHGLTAHTLDPDSLLWHLCRHLIFHADVFTRLRLIWIADIARLAESFRGRIDWERVLHVDPIVRNVLSLIEAVIPLSDGLRAAARLSAAPTAGSWDDFRGWPRVAVGEQRRQGKGTRSVLVDTFLPSAWWLRLHYGLSSASPLWWHRWARHPVDVLGWSARYVRQRAAARAWRS